MTAVRLLTPLVSLVLLVTAAEGQEAAPPAQAQVPTPPEAPKPDRGPKGVEEIIVTAERREQNLQDVGQTVSAFSFESLTEGNIQDAYDLQLKVPGLVATGGLPAITLRGLGQDSDVLGPGIDPGFQLHINNIYVSQVAVALLGFHDLERVEVLPGPQGTLFGRNSTGGSMNFHTKRPTLDEWEVSGDLDVGRWENIRLRGVVNVPIVEGKLAGRFALLREFPSNQVELKGASGFRQELSNNALSGGLSLRSSLRWTPTENITLDLIGAWTKDEDNGGSARMLEPYPTFGVGQDVLFGSVDYTGATPLPSNPEVQRANTEQRQVYETGWGQAILTVDIPMHVLSLNGNYQHWDYALGSLDYDRSDLDVSLLKLFDKHKTWTGEVTIASAYENAEGFLGRLNWILGANYQDDDAPDTNVPIWNNQAAADTANFAVFDVFDDIAPLSASTPDALRHCGGVPCLFQPADPTLPVIRFRSDVKTETLGVFADGGIDVTDWLHFQGGVRYSKTSRKMIDKSFFDSVVEPYDVVQDVASGGTQDFCVDVVGLPPVFFGIPTRPKENCFEFFILPALQAQTAVPLDASNVAFLLPVRGNLNFFDANDTGVVKDKTWDSVTGHLKVEVRPSEGHLFYFDASRGVRHGGFNFLVVEPFESEEILAYEIGAKNALFDNRLLLNASVFFYDFENRFINETVDNVTQTTNAPKAEVLGVELQWVYAPVDGLELSGNMGWLDTEITADFFSQDNTVDASNPTSYCPGKTYPFTPGSFFGGLPAIGDLHGYGPTCDGAPFVNLKGQRLPRSPEWSVSMSAQYAMEFSLGTFTPRVDFAWRDDTYFRQFENPLDLQKAYTRTDARLRWDWSETPLWVEAYVQNIEDRGKVKTQVELPGNRPRTYWLAAPLTFGLRLGWTFKGDTLSELNPF